MRLSIKSFTAKTNCSSLKSGNDATVVKKWNMQPYKDAPHTFFVTRVSSDLVETVRFWQCALLQSNNGLVFLNSNHMLQAVSNCHDVNTSCKLSNVQPNSPFSDFLTSQNRISSIGFLKHPHLSSSFQTSSKYASIFIEVQVKITKPGLWRLKLNQWCPSMSCCYATVCPKTDQNDTETLPPHLELQVLHVRSHQVCGNGLDRLCYTAVFLQEEGQLVVVSLELLLLRKRRYCRNQRNPATPSQ